MLKIWDRISNNIGVMFKKGHNSGESHGIGTADTATKMYFMVAQTTKY